MIHININDFGIFLLEKNPTTSISYLNLNSVCMHIFLLTFPCIFSREITPEIINYWIHEFFTLKTKRKTNGVKNVKAGSPTPIFGITLECSTFQLRVRYPAWHLSLTYAGKAESLNDNVLIKTFPSCAAVAALPTYSSPAWKRRHLGKSNFHRRSKRKFAW